MGPSMRRVALVAALAVGVAVGLPAGRFLAPSEQDGGRPAADAAVPDGFAQLGRYAAANAALGPPRAGEARVVFMGDSITEAWAADMPGFFAGRPFVDRGIAGQTTPQMLVRFRQDVVDLAPRVVVILAGINDLLAEPDAATPRKIEDNLSSMVEIARANGIHPVLASLLPCARARDGVAEVNRWIADYVRRNSLVRLDYHALLADAEGGLSAALTRDGLHPNPAGYRVMAPLAEAAIAAASRMPSPR